VFDIISKLYYVERTCVDIKDEKLNILNVVVGDYELTGFLGEDKGNLIAESKTTRSFSVKKYEDILPHISFLPPIQGYKIVKNFIDCYY